MKQKIIAFLLILIFISSFFAGCTQSESLELAICGSYSVPGMMCPDLKGGSYQDQIIERDSKGRILFSYTTQNSITKQQETALIVCQHIDDDKVFYYEDICYLFEPVSESDIDLLKKSNDWDQEMDFGKMTNRPIKYTFDLYLKTEDVLDYRKAKDSYCQSNNIDPEQIQEMVLLDVNPNGMELHYLTLEQEGMTENYFVIVNLSYETFSYQINDALSDFKQLPQFKNDHGWNLAENSEQS